MMYLTNFYTKNSFPDTGIKRQKTSNNKIPATAAADDCCGSCGGAVTKNVELWRMSTLE
jgi:hypothetical protein